MSSLLHRIKNKYFLKKIFEHLPYNITLHIVFGSHKLLSNMDFTKETYKEFSQIKKTLVRFYDINKYYNYLDKNNYNTEKEKIIYGCLNDAPFNIDLFVWDNEWMNIIKNIYKVNLIICPNLLYYIYNLNNIKQKKFFYLLNFYKNNISEITFSYFNTEWKNNFEIVTQIINIIKRIFKVKVDNQSTNNNIIISKGNYFHKIKKISFEYNELVFSSNFLSKIDDILSLNEIQELLIDTNLFDENQFTDIIKFISIKMNSLKYLKINNFGYNISHYADFNILCSNLNDHIEILDLSDSFYSPDLISVLNSKKYPLKELKINLYSCQNNIEWKFIDNSIDTLQSFEIEVKNNKNHYNKEKIIYALNKIKKLKNLKMILDINPKDLNNFKNKNNIEYLNIDVNLFYNNLDLFPIDLTNYFIDFKNLKSLTITKKEYLDLMNNNNLLYEFFEFIFPINLKSLNLYNFDDTIIIPLLNKNLNHLIFIEEFKLENSKFKNKTFQILSNILNSFKNLQKLSLNKIDIINSLSNKNEENIFYEFIPLILKNKQSLIELDISHNKCDEKIFKSNLFKNIQLSIPKKLFSIKIFDEEKTISEKTFNLLKELFGYTLDLENNYPNII